MKKIILHTFLPLFIGGVIYLLIRPANFLIHSIVEESWLLPSISTIRQASISFSSSLPNIIVYSLPDGLWVYSFTATIFYVWNFKINNWSLLFSSVPVILGIGSELGQFFKIVPGTFDFIDIIFYLFGFILSISILTNQKKNG